MSPFLWNLMIHYCIHKGATLNPNLSPRSQWSLRTVHNGNERASSIFWQNEGLSAEVMEIVANIMCQKLQCLTWHLGMQVMQWWRPSIIIIYSLCFKSCEEGHSDDKILFSTKTHVTEIMSFNLSACFRYWLYFCDILCWGPELNLSYKFILVCISQI
jgi:hypothetical protein